MSLMTLARGLVFSGAFAAAVGATDTAQAQGIGIQIGPNGIGVVIDPGRSYGYGRPGSNYSDFGCTQERERIRDAWGRKFDVPVTVCRVPKYAPCPAGTENRGVTGNGYKVCRSRHF